MSATTIVSVGRPAFDPVGLAVAGFLARYSGSTRVSYAGDLRQFLAWWVQVNLVVFDCRARPARTVGPLAWRSGAWPGRPSAAGCPRCRGSTGSACSTASSSTPRPSTCAAPS